MPGDSTLFDRIRDYPPELKKVLPLTTVVFHDLPSLARRDIHFELRLVDPVREHYETTIVGRGECSACMMCSYAYLIHIIRKAHLACLDAGRLDGRLYKPLPSLRSKRD